MDEQLFGTTIMTFVFKIISIGYEPKWMFARFFIYMFLCSINGQIKYMVKE